MAETRAFHVVLFGATGFTGALVAQYLTNSSEPLRWAIAGRNREKLQQLHARLSGPHARPEILVADVNDPQSLREMVSRTRVVISTVGPYILYGEALLAVCAELGTDYVDLTGEPEFLALSLEKYHAQAELNRAKIVHACGFDSIPHDLGAYFAVKALRRTMTVGEQDTLSINVQGIVQGALDISGGTWHSIVLLLSRAHEGLRTPQPAAGRKLGRLPSRLQYHRQRKLWLVPMPTIDPLIVLHSARVLDEYGPDFRYGHALGLRWFAQVAGVVLGAGTLFGLAQLKLTRQWLLKLKAPGDGPDEAARAKGWFRVSFDAWSGSHRLKAAVRGGDPGYGETAKMVSETALCLAFDRNRLPNRFGVVTTASGLGEPLIERLQRAGILFEVQA